MLAFTEGDVNMTVDIAEEEANNIFNELKEQNANCNGRLFMGLDKAVYSTNNNTDQKVVSFRYRLVKKLKEAVGFYILDHPQPDGTPNRDWLRVINRIDELLKYVQKYLQ